MWSAKAMVTIVDSIVGSVSGALSNRLLLLLLTVSKDRLNGLGDFGRRCMQSVLLLLLLSSVALVAGLAMPSIGRNELGASSMIGDSGELLLLRRAASDTAELANAWTGRAWREVDIWRYMLDATVAAAAGSLACGAGTAIGWTERVLVGLR